jgi:hypothetical protein
LFSIFPGNISDSIKSDSPGRYNNTEDYVSKDNNTNVKICTGKTSDSGSIGIPQYYNQYLYFRIKDAYSGVEYYNTTAAANENDKLNSTDINYFNLSGCVGAVLYPYPINKEDLTIGEPGQLYRNLKPKESINLPLVFIYKLDDKTNKSISKTISFDIRTSLYNEPTNYKVAIKANYDAQLEDKIKRAQNTNSTYRAVVINK